MEANMSWYEAKRVAQDRQKWKAIMDVLFPYELFNIREIASPDAA